MEDDWNPSPVFLPFCKLPQKSRLEIEKNFPREKKACFWGEAFNQKASFHQTLEWLAKKRTIIIINLRRVEDPIEIFPQMSLCTAASGQKQKEALFLQNAFE